jgi:hypothetical protein
VKQSVRVAVLFVLWAPSAVAAGWGDCVVAIALSDTIARLTSIARCSYVSGDDVVGAVQLTGEHSFATERGVCSGYGYCGSSLLISPYDADTTYSAAATFKASQFSVFDTITKTASFRTPPPIRPRTPVRNTIDCPLVLDLNGDGIQTTGLDRAVHFFDINDDGFGDPTGWLLETGEDALLWMDLDNNDVASPREIFGSHMLLPAGGVAFNGFQALEVWDYAELGGNDDGVITKRDEVWKSLRLWIDRNHDGFSQPAEIERLADRKIEELHLDREHVHVPFPDGNSLMLKGSYTRNVVVQGGKNELQTFRMDDVLFVRR